MSIKASEGKAVDVNEPFSGFWNAPKKVDLRQRADGAGEKTLLTSGHRLEMHMAVTTLTPKAPAPRTLETPVEVREPEKNAEKSPEPPPPAAPVEVASPSPPRRSLRPDPAPKAPRKGDEGAAVNHLQSTLKQLGFDPGAIDGVYGHATSKAVKGFAIQHGITNSDGSVVTPEITKALATTTKAGDSGAPVKELQSALLHQGFDPGALDGVYGKSTTRAVKSFAQYSGIQNCDGTVLTPAITRALSGAAKLGDEGPRVKQLQTDLRQQGFDPGALDGHYGKLTAQAVKGFADKHGIKSDGVAVTPEISQAMAALKPAPSGQAATTAKPGTKSDPIRGLQKATDDAAVKQGDKGAGVRQLQKDLNGMGIKVDVDGKYGKATAEGVKDYATQHSLPGDGSEVTPEIAESISTHKNAPTSQTHDLEHDSATLVKELQLKDPALLEKINDTFDHVKSLATDDEKSATLKEGFSKLKVDMDDLKPKLSPEAQAAWKRLSAAVGDGGNILRQARMKDPGYRAARDAEFKRVVGSLTEELSAKRPEELKKILDRSAKIKDMPEGPQKLAALKDHYDEMNKFVMLNSNEMSPEAKNDWQDFKARVDEGFDTKDIGALQLMARKASLDAVERIVSKPGVTPDDQQMIEELHKEINPSLAAADAADKTQGNHGVSWKQLKQIVPHMSEARAKEVAPDLNRVMFENKIVTRRQQAEFIAQTAHESQGYTRYREMGGRAYFTEHYDPGIGSAKHQRMVKGLGNVNPGDGPRFCGRGAIMVTGRAHYKELSEFVYGKGDHRLVDHPELVEKLPLAMDSAGWFWTKNKINHLAEDGNFKGVTVKINGGTNGFQDRLVLYKRGLDALTT